MGAKKQVMKPVKEAPSLAAKPAQGYHGRLVPAPDKDNHLDPVQLQQLEQSFSRWAEASARSDVQISRRRILLIFLLIRYTGAKLSEVLGLDPLLDIDLERQSVRFGRKQAESGRPPRKVQLSETLCRQIRALAADSSFKLDADPGFVRRKFYERAEACGFAKQRGAPETLRRSRAIELMQSALPLPAVQMLLGHSTPNLTSSYVSFSEDDIHHVTKMFLEKESARKTSARNTFFGKVQRIQKGDIQSLVELLTIGGHRLTTVITNDSLQRLGLKKGKLITAEVKAPWVMLHKCGADSECSADNMLEGIVERITAGGINTEYIVRISDGTEVCAIVTSESCQRLALGQGDKVRVVFNSFAVVLLAD